MKPAPAIHHLCRLRRQAFTLLELLVVMAIIAILSGIMVPTIRGVMIQIKQTRTETTGTNLRNAISAYFTEYRRLPYDFREHTGEAVFLQSDEKLMNILCGMDSAAGDNGLNPSRNVYFSDRNARKLVKTATIPASESTPAETPTSTTRGANTIRSSSTAMPTGVSRNPPGTKPLLHTRSPPPFSCGARGLTRRLRVRMTISRCGEEPRPSLFPPAQFTCRPHCFTDV